MATAKERRDIFYNVLARVGMNGDVLGEYAKAMSGLNGMESLSNIAPPTLPNDPSTQSQTSPMTPNINPMANMPQ